MIKKGESQIEETKPSNKFKGQRSLFSKNDFSISRTSESEMEKILNFNMNFKSKVTESKVVLISNLNPNFKINVDNLHNLISCFGNITKILYMPNMKKCLVQFENEDYSKSCIMLLNNQFFLGNQLKVNYSNYAELDFKKKK